MNMQRKRVDIFRRSPSVMGVALCALLASNIHAADVGVTIQTSISSAYGATAPLTEGTSKLLTTVVNTDDSKKIGTALANLKDGDVLVLAVHSNPAVFGIGSRTVAWSRFWTEFDIQRPPRLASVIIGGCMATREIKNGKEIDRPISKEELERLRQLLNAKTIFAPTSTISPARIAHDTFAILKGIQAGTKLNNIDLAGHWHFGSDPGVDRGVVTLEDLRTLSRSGAGGILLTELRDDGMRGRFRKGESKPFTGIAYLEHRPGLRKWEAEFVDGFTEGRVTEWHSNGQKSRELFRQNRLTHGTVTMWYPSGKLRATEEWREGKMNGPAKGWYENGKPAWEMSMQDGKRHGSYVKYHDNGQMSESRNYIVGKESGESIFYDKNGRVVKRIIN